MRILHIITRFLRGGAEEKTLLEIQHLKSKHDFMLASGPEVRLESLRRLESLGIPFLRIPSLKHYAPWLAPSAVREIRQILRKESFDLVHTHSTEAGLLGREASRKEHTPRIVHSIHGLEFTRAHPYLIRRSVIWFHRHLARYTHRYFSNADVLSQAFVAERIGHRSQYALVRSGVDLSQIQNASPVSLEGDPVVLTAGRLAKGKGFEDLLFAVHQLQDRRPHLRVAIAGDGPHREYLEQRVRNLNLDRRVDFLGHRDDLPGLLRAASVFVLASHREGTPRVVTQAMAVGCPVVATNVDAIPEQIDHQKTGLLVPPQNPHALAQALEEVFSYPDRALERAQNGKKSIQRFDLSHMIQALQFQYEQLETAASSKNS